MRVDYSRAVGFEEGGWGARGGEDEVCGEEAFGGVLFDSGEHVELDFRMRGLLADYLDSSKGDWNEFYHRQVC